MTSHLQLSFDLRGLDPEWAEAAAILCGASAVTFVDARDDPLSAVLEPAPGEELSAPTELKHQGIFLTSLEADGETEQQSKVPKLPEYRERGTKLHNSDEAL